MRRHGCHGDQVSLWVVRLRDGCPARGPIQSLAKDGGMQKLRETFRRARGPEAPGAHSLEVPKQVRSASFDEIRLSGSGDGSSLLEVPGSRSQRSRSFDSATANPEPLPVQEAAVTRWKRSTHCVHCDYLEEQQRRTFYVSSGSGSDEALSCQVTVTLSVQEPSPPSSDECGEAPLGGLELPPKQLRSASVDSPFLNVPPVDGEDSAQKTGRSRSVDLALPTSSSGYVSKTEYRKAIHSDIKVSSENGDSRVLRSVSDWGESARNGEHLWSTTSASGDLCYVGDYDCSKQGPRMKCPACKVIAHSGCISILVDKMKFMCKPTFKDVGVRQYREQTGIHHHWVHRRHQKGRCDHCGKSFQSKLSFGSKEIVAISCSWCKIACHNKETCFTERRFHDHCTLGRHASIIVPPSWIVKLPRKGSFKSSIRRSPKKKASTKKKAKKEGDKDQHRTFAIKPIPSANSKPLLVFINPKSGGNQGTKLIQKFQWLLNPRQVFDLSENGPATGLELYKKVPNLRILACGGDGTAGWILSVLDEISITPAPPVAVLPLGTGNDLARSLDWGSGYTDEPISKILANVEEGEIKQLDRWDLQVEKNADVDMASCEEGKDTLPLTVVNNYFSIGVDAHIALEFHEAREAHPERFNSRLRNKMFYGQAGGKDLLQRKWKDLCNYVTLECDGQDLTPKLKELKVHSILFLNIPSYGGGTKPWGNVSPGLGMQETDDGLLEVIGLTTYQLPFLQAGGHGTCIAQCRQARLVTSRTIPMQVDGEPCKLLPSVIHLKLRNKAYMIAKAKRCGRKPAVPTLEMLTLEVRKLNMSDYETYHYDKEKLQQCSISLGRLRVSQDTDLEAIRNEINKQTDSSAAQRLSPDWCFLDSCTAERFFRIDRAQEHLHYVVDICGEELFVLDPTASEDDPPSVNGSSSSLLHFDSCAADLAVSGVITAAKSNDLRQLKQLHENNFGLLSVDQLGMTALHHAAKLGHQGIVQFLISSAPSSVLDMVDKEKGQTALHMATKCKRQDVCCMLVSAGASLAKVDARGMTARDIALSENEEELAAYFESQEFLQRQSREKETTV